MLRLQPLTIKAANRFVDLHHRHNKPTQGGLFAIGATNDESVLIGVAIVGRPVARGLVDGFTCEITRTCTDGARNANSFLYAACFRAAKAIGYRRVVTYTLESEGGASLRAVGFRPEAELPERSRETRWNNRLRSRAVVDLFGTVTVPDGVKIRWLKVL